MEKRTSAVPGTMGPAARLARAAALLFAALLLTTCSDTPVSPSRRGQGFVSLAPRFPPFSRAAGLALDNVRLVVVRPPGDTLLDKTYPFPADQSRLSLSEAVQIQGESELLEVILTCLSGTTTLFRGSAMLLVRVGPATGSPALVPVEWVGPGDEVTTILLAPRDTVLTFGASLAFRVAASDAQGQPVTAYYLSWQSSDPGQQPDATGLLRAANARTTLRISASTPGGGASDSTTVTVVPPPANVRATGGTGQTAPVGTRLPQELEVEVRGPDDLPVPGVTVSFTPPAGGSVDAPTRITDGSGRARTGATLGPAEGEQSFTAAVVGAGAAIITATATAVALPTVSFTSASQSVSEAAGTATITVQLSSPATQPVTIPFILSGTAALPADFTVSATPLAIPAGGTSASITVTLVQDGVAEPDETVIATLGTPVNATPGSVTVHTLTITGQQPTVSFTSASQSGAEGGATVVVTAQLSSPSSLPVTVPFTLTGSATRQVDYTATASPLTITAGSSTAAISIDLVADGTAEPDETIIATLEPPTNATLGGLTTHTVTITGQVPTVAFSQAVQTVPEGVVATISVALSSASTQQVTVPFTLTGTAGDPGDYTASGSPLTIPAGGTSASITVTIVADGVAEPDETVIATLGTPTNATLGATTVHTLTIAGQVPAVSFSTVAQSANEGSVATITVELSTPSTQAVTVPYALTGSATVGADYTATASPLIIAAGNSSATVSLTLAADGVAETDETVVVTLGTPTNASLGNPAVHTLTVPGQVPAASFATAAQSVSEGAGTSTIVVQLSTPSTQAVTIPYTVSGTAAAPGDYTIPAGPLVIPAGDASGTITVDVVADGVAEPDETVVIALGTPANATLGAITGHTLTITGQLPSVSFTQANTSVAEGGAVTITAQLSTTTTQTVTLPFTLTGTASGADYTASASPLTIPAGGTSASITVNALTDGVDEPDESVVVTLDPPTNAALGGTTVHTVTILGQTPVVSFALAAQTVNEGVTASIAVRLSSPSTQTVTVPFSVAGSAGNPADYTISGSPVQITPGNTSATIDVTVAGDAVAEPGETVVVTLGSPINALLGAPSVHTLTIAAQQPAVSFTAASQTAAEGTAATITAQLSGVSTQAVTIPFSLTGTATTGTDYTVNPASPLTIAAGNTTATLTLNLAADGVAEPNENAVVTMGTPVNAGAGAITVHTVTIAAQLPTVSFSAATQTVSEGAVATITAQLSSPSTQMVTIPFSATGTATNPADYTITATPLVITPGNTSGTISVTTVVDGVAEPLETVVITMGTPTNAAAGAITVHAVSIAAQVPTVTFTSATQSVSEGVGTATVTAQLSSPSTQAVSVPYSLGGTATSPADYTAPASPLVIPAGSTSGTVNLTIVADPVAEPTETVILTMGTPINATPGAITTHTVSIQGQTPTVSFTVANQTVSEGVVATITAQLSGPSSLGVSVPFSLGGTATNGTDYTASASPIVIAAGNTSGTVSLNVASDAVAEPNETVVVTMGTPTNANLGAIAVHTLTIAAQVPTVSWTTAAQSTAEGASAVITAQLSQVSTLDVTVPYTLSGTATSGSDYTIPASPLVIPAGKGNASVAASIVADPAAEPSETLVLTMGTPANATRGAITVHTVTITGQLPVVKLTPDSLSFSGVIGGQPPAVQSVAVTNAGADVLSRLLASVVYLNGSGWLQTSLSGTIAPTTLNVQARPESVTVAGSYVALVVVRSNISGVTPDTARVVFNVTAPPTAPRISNISVSLIRLNDAQICTLDTPAASSFRVVFNYTDPNGDGPTSISQARLGIAYDFLPQHNTGGFSNYTYQSSLSGNGATGTATTTQCYRFGTNTSVNVTMTIQDLGGLTSPGATVNILKPAGSN